MFYWFCFLRLVILYPSELQSLDDPLPSWNEGKTKRAITDFVEDVTNPTCDCFVAVPDRIAVFDNDGNLWSEQPAYFQFFFAIDRVKEMAADHPEWLTTQPFQSILENDLETFAGFGEHGILEVRDGHAMQEILPRSLKVL